MIMINFPQLDDKDAIKLIVDGANKLLKDLWKPYLEKSKIVFDQFGIYRSGDISCFYDLFPRRFSNSEILDGIQNMDSLLNSPDYYFADIVLCYVIASLFDKEIEKREKTKGDFFSGIIPKDKQEYILKKMYEFHSKYGYSKGECIDFSEDILRRYNDIRDYYHFYFLNYDYDLLDYYAGPSIDSFHVYNNIDSLTNIFGFPVYMPCTYVSNDYT